MGEIRNSNAQINRLFQTGMKRFGEIRELASKKLTPVQEGVREIVRSVEAAIKDGYKPSIGADIHGAMTDARAYAIKVTEQVLLEFQEHPAVRAKLQEARTNSEALRSWLPGDLFEGTLPKGVRDAMNKNFYEKFFDPESVSRFTKGFAHRKSVLDFARFWEMNTTLYTNQGEGSMEPRVAFGKTYDPARHTLVTNTETPDYLMDGAPQEIPKWKMLARDLSLDVRKACVTFFENAPYHVFGVAARAGGLISGKGPVWHVTGDIPPYDKPMDEWIKALPPEKQEAVRSRIVEATPRELKAGFEEMKLHATRAAMEKLGLRPETAVGRLAYGAVNVGLCGLLAYITPYAVDKAFELVDVDPEEHKKAYWASALVSMHGSLALANSTLEVIWSSVVTRGEYAAVTTPWGIIATRNSARTILAGTLSKFFDFGSLLAAMPGAILASHAARYEGADRDVEIFAGLAGAFVPPAIASSLGFSSAFGAVAKPLGIWLLGREASVIAYEDEVDEGRRGEDLFTRGHSADLDDKTYGWYRQMAIRNLGWTGFYHQTSAYICSLPSVVEVSLGIKDVEETPCYEAISTYENDIATEVTRLKELYEDPREWPIDIQLRAAVDMKDVVWLDDVLMGEDFSGEILLSYLKDLDGKKEYEHLKMLTSDPCYARVMHYLSAPEGSYADENFAWGMILATLKGDSRGVRKNAEDLAGTQTSIEMGGEPGAITDPSCYMTWNLKRVERVIDEMGITVEDASEV